MMRWKRANLWLCAFFAFAVWTSSAFAEEGAALRVTYQSPGGEAISADFLREGNEDARWLWLTVGEEFSLESLAIAYLPVEEGVFRAVTPDTADVDALDFTQSEWAPLAFVVEDADGLAIWSGWITVSHDAPPADLPDMPDLQVAPTPPVVGCTTQAPVEEPIAVQTEQPTEEPSVAPIIVTETPALFLTPSPTVVPTFLPTVAPMDTPAWILTEKPTQIPIVAPTPGITSAPIYPPTFAPTMMPTPSATLPPQPNSGHALVLGDPAVVRALPGGAVIGHAGAESIVYVWDQQLDAGGILWCRVSLEDMGGVGYIQADMLRWMTKEEENQAFFAGLLPIPTLRPIPAPTPVPMPAPISGYAKVAWPGVTVWSQAGQYTSSLGQLAADTVLFVTGQAVDAYGALWLSVRIREIEGYVPADMVRMMSAAEVEAYFRTPVSTPTPVVAPTLNPGERYLVVNENRVNFRREPNGFIMGVVNRGAIGRMITAEPVYVDGHAWYCVRIDGVDGYLSGELVSLVEFTSAVPTPSPESLPVPTAAPQRPFQRLRTALETARYTLFARDSNAISYAVRDFDGDGRMELLLVDVQTTKSMSYQLSITLYALRGGRVEAVSALSTAPVLQPSTEMQVLLLEQGGRDILYVAMRDMKTGRVYRSQGLMVQNGALTETPLAGDAKNPQPLMLAVADSQGDVVLDDRTGLYPVGPSAEAPPTLRDVIWRIFTPLLRIIGGENG